MQQAASKTPSEMMSAEQMQEAYNQQGYLSAVPVLLPAELEEARQAFSALEEQFGKEYTQYSLHNVHLEYEWVMALAKNPRLLGAIQAVIGPDVLLLDSRFICKYPNTSVSGGKPGADRPDGTGTVPDADLPYVAWHQDMRYWGIDGGPVVSVWLAMDDSLEDNGALKVIPGSHQSGMLLHRQATRHGNLLSVNQEIPEELVETGKSVLCPLLAGQMSIHDGFLVHGSDPNTSQRRRCGFVIRYVPPCAYPIHDPDRPRKFLATMLASGVDKFQHFSK